jgi:hypothetical protein
MTDPSSDLYAVMMLPPGSSIEDIRRQYRRLARIYHPDRNPNDIAWCEEQMRALNDAYAVLSSPSRKAQYDRLADPKVAAMNRRAAAAEPPRPGRPAARPSHAHRHTADDDIPTPAPAAPERPAPNGSRSRRPVLIGACAALGMAVTAVLVQPSSPTAAPKPAHAAQHTGKPAAALTRSHEIRTAVAPARRHHARLRKTLVAGRTGPVSRRPLTIPAAHTTQRPHLTADQKNAIALHLAEQAEAHGRTRAAASLRKHGISPDGMNLSQMRRALEASR